MKKLITHSILFVSVLGLLGQTYAQSNIKASSKSLPKDVVTMSKNALRDGSGTNYTQALFDVTFNYNAGTQINQPSLAAVCYTGTEFWVSRWNKDSLFTLSPTGTLTAGFQIPGVGSTSSGVRAMTFDGTFIYAGINTTSIKKIDPATKTLAASITSAAPFPVRSIAWDSTANGGAGGFWVSNFGTAFYLISMTGTVLDSITLAKHTLQAVYGLAFDPWTAGGPYIWAFDQTPTGTGATIVRINRTTGLPSAGVTHDVNLEASGSLAGGITTTWRHDATKKEIIVCTQTTSRLIGYELSDYNQAAIDATADSLFFNPPYTQVPAFLVTPFNWTVKSSNKGINTLSDLGTELTVNDGNTNVYAPAMAHNLNVASNGTATANFGPYTPAQGDYLVQAVINTGSQTDKTSIDDTVSYNMFIGDSVIAREDGSATGSLGIGSGGGTLGQTFNLPFAAYVSSVTYFCNAPTSGDKTSADFYSFAGFPQTVLASTGDYVFTNADTNGVVVDLPFIGGPQLFSAGTYFVGVNEFTDNVTLGTTDFNFQPNTGWVIFGTNPWQPSEYYGFKKTYILRLNVINDVKVVEIENQKFTVYPNPAASQISVESFQNSPNYELELYDMIGNKVSATSSVITAKTTTLDVSKLATGMYLLKTIVGDKSVTTKVSVAR